MAEALPKFVWLLCEKVSDGDEEQQTFTPTSKLLRSFLPRYTLTPCNYSRALGRETEHGLYLIYQDDFLYDDSLSLNRSITAVTKDFGLHCIKGGMLIFVETHEAEVCEDVIMTDLNHAISVFIDHRQQLLCLPPLPEGPSAKTKAVRVFPNTKPNDYNTAKFASAMLPPHHPAFKKGTPASDVYTLWKDVSPKTKLPAAENSLPANVATYILTRCVLSELPLAWREHCGSVVIVSETEGMVRPVMVEAIAAYTAICSLNRNIRLGHTTMAAAWKEAFEQLLVKGGNTFITGENLADYVELLIAVKDKQRADN